MSHTKEVLMKFEAGEKLTPAEKQFCHVKTDCCNADIISKEVVDVDQSVRTIYVCSKCLKELQ